MKKALVIFTTALLLFIICAILTLYIALQGSYTTKLVNRLFEQYSSIPVSVYEAHFQWPNHLTLQGVEINSLQAEPIKIEQVQLWLSSDSLTHAIPTFDSILINGVLLQDGMPTIPSMGNIKLHQLAITNLDYSDGDFISRDTDIQIKNPQFNDQPNSIPYGSIQYSAEQIYWQREAFNKVLFDVEHKAENSTVYGATFEWRGGYFSTQAEQYEQGWSLVNATIDRLRLNTKQWQEIDTTNWTSLFKHIDHINSLDVLASTIETTDFSLVNANLSVENLSVKKDLWQQENGYISLGAESLNYYGYTWLDPTFKSYFDQNLTSVEALSFEFEQGLIKTMGELTPNSVYLKDLDINGLKWIYESVENNLDINHYIRHLDSLNIDKLTVKNSQFIQLATQPNWQFSGLSVDGKDLTLVKESKIGLWDGKMRITANNASFKNLLSSQPLISMQSNDGVWHLDDAFIPLEKGLIEATASYTLSLPSQPWRVEAFVDGVPLEFISDWVPLPINANAITEFQVGVSGLGGDDLMIRHSLNGQLVGSLRDSVLLLEDDHGEIQSLPFESSEIVLIADRGRIHLDPIELKGSALAGTLAGEIDLLETEQNALLMQLQHGCKKQYFDLLNNSQETKGCQSNSTEKP